MLDRFSNLSSFFKDKDDDTSIEDLAELCTWFPITPNIEEWEINAYQKRGNFLMYGCKKKVLRKRLLAQLKGDMFSNIAFPITRRVFTPMFTNELVSIQPMSIPSGLIFYADYQYDNSNLSGGVDYLSSSGSYGILPSTP